MKIGILLIATNKYNSFLQPFITSADSFLLKNSDVTYFIFTDKEQEITTTRNVVFIKIEHKPWPFMTLTRYHLFSSKSHLLQEMNYIFYCDVDMLFVSDVDLEIIEERVATIHPGFEGGRGFPETNPMSLAYVSPSEKMQYYAGGFNGGSTDEFLKMSKVLSANITSDLRKGIIAVWHDESHLNRYMIDNPPTKILDPSYCCPEQSVNPSFGRKLLALEKNHAEYRNS